ncbi:MAG: hypothetical protein WBA44_05185 [Mesorhizobium sp.]
MSAYYALAHADRIELLTDGAVYHEDGTLTDIRQKVWTSSRLPFAVTGRGTMSVVSLLAIAAVACTILGTVDEAIERFQAALNQMAERIDSAEFELAICAISETSGPVILYASGLDAYGTGIETFRLHDAGKELGGGPAVDPAGLDLSDGLRGCGVELFERMRAIQDCNPARPDLPDHHGIGGHVDLTIVSAAGCTTERLHEWTDVIGLKITPIAELLKVA